MEYALVLVWWVVCLTLAAAALPVAALLCPRLADRGAGVALPLVLAVFGVVGYWVGRVAFGWPAVLGALAVLLGGMVVALQRGAEPRWDRFAEVATVFTLAFGLVVAIRAVDPSVLPGNGEKFLDHGLLASLLRADALPPEDMWFAGQSVEYYYGGHMIAAMLARLTGTSAPYAYNLALAVFFGAYVAAAYGLSGALGAARGGSYRAAGAAGAFLVGLASNLETPIQFLGWLLPEPYGHDLVQLFGLVDDGALNLARGPGHFGYWDASRVIPGTINEFPLFAFLNGDLHAHMMSPPLLLLAAGLLFSYYRTPAESVWRRRGLLALVGPVGGLLAVVSTWSFPTVGGLTVLTLALAPATPWSLLPDGAEWRIDAALDGIESAVERRAAREGARGAVAVAGGVAVLAVGVATAWPFLTSSAAGRSIALNSPALRSGLAGLLVVHGLFLLVSVPYLWGRADPSAETVVAAAMAVGTAFVVTMPASLTAVAVFGPIVAVGWYLARAERAGFEAVLVVGVAGLVVLVELVHVVENGGAQTRLNTVFKTYSQIWALWAVAAGAMLARVARLGPAAAGARQWIAGRSGADRRTALRAALGVALLLSASIYGAVALHTHFTHDSRQKALEDPTLNGRYILTTADAPGDLGYGEAAAIRWLADLEGQPNIVTTTWWGYNWRGAPSALTGVPTVLGWEYHQGRYHGRAAASRRARHVQTIYTGNTSARADLLARYDVAYIYVGPKARQKYGELAAFAADPGIERYRVLGQVVIYRVTQSELAT